MAVHNIIRRTFGHYVFYHEHGPRMLHYFSLLAATAYPVFYLLRFVKETAPYDDAVVRLTATLLCIGLLLHRWWPERLRPFYLAYSYLVLTYTLPFALMFTALMNDGGTVGVANTLMAAFFVILMTDWRNTVAMLTLGYGAAAISYVLLAPEPQFNADYVMRLPILLLVVTGGCLFKRASNEAVAARMRLGYSALAGSIAHEMRNPLGQFGSVLQDMRSTLASPASREAAAHASLEIDALYRSIAQGEVAVRRGLQIIEMTLDEVAARPVDTREFALVCAAAATERAILEYGYDTDQARSRVRLSVREDFLFQGNETSYVFVIFNLLKNALFYAPLNPALRIDIVVESGRVTVTDTGPGIDDTLRERLFEPFRSAGKRGGSGLGLAYCRRVMRALGGEIGCAPRGAPGEPTGARFVLDFAPLPEGGGRELRQQAMVRSAGALAGRRLLVVDDDPLVRVMARARLALPLVEVDEAADGESALAALGERRYDAVLLDITMPGLDGYAVARRIRNGAAPLNRDACIVAHTAEPIHIAAAKALRSGMDAFIGKACEPLGLLEVIVRTLESSRRGVTLADADASGVLAASVRPVALDGRKLLLADDNDAGRGIVARFLREAGATVIEVSHGQAALDCIRHYASWDAVMLDIDMPGMDGLAVARAIRNGPQATRQVPVLALTAHCGRDMHEQMKAAGMDAVVTKPADAHALSQALQRAIAARATARAAAEGALDILVIAPAALDGDEAPEAAEAALRQRMEQGVGPGPRPARAQAIEDTDSAQPPLLDPTRLAALQRIDMLGELEAQYLPRLDSALHALTQALRVRDMSESLRLLHSMVGMSGEMGARRLHATLKPTYVALREDALWPGDGWPRQINALWRQTTRALHAHLAQAGVASADAPRPDASLLP